MLRKSSCFSLLRAPGRINNRLKPIKRLIKKFIRIKNREEATPGVNSARVSFSVAAAVFSHAVRSEGTAETVGMFNKW